MARVYKTEPCPACQRGRLVRQYITRAWAVLRCPVCGHAVFEDQPRQREQERVS